VKKNVQEVYPTTAKFFAGSSNQSLSTQSILLEHSSAPKATSLITDLFPIAQNEAPVDDDSPSSIAKLLDLVNA
jgi:hypothetical protein